MRQFFDLAAQAFRAYNTDGVPTSGVKQVDKSDVVHVFDLADALTNVSAISATTSAQPSSPAVGDVYVLPVGKSGAAWTAMAAGSLAVYLSTGWLEVIPKPGLLAWVQDQTSHFYMSASGWLVLPGYTSPAKATVKAASTANLTRSGAQAIDGVSCVAGDRVLVKDQSAPAENGVYVVAAGSWTRATDFDAWAKLPGAIVPVEQGTANGDAVFECTVNSGGTLNTTAITFAQAASGSIGSARWGYFAALSTFVGATWSAADLNAWTTAMGGASALRTAFGLAIGANVPAWSANLDTFAGIAPTANAQTLLGHTFSQMRTDLGLVIGTNVQAWSTNLDALAGFTTDADAAMAANSNTRLATQAAIVSYVASKLDGRAWKQPVRAATTAAGTLASSFANGQAIDGVTLATGDRILIKNQASASENGLYTVNASGAPTRSSDADTGAEMLNATVMVEEGTTNADTQWTCTNNGTITINSTALTFAQIGAAGTSYTADETTLHLAGAQFSIKANGVTNNELRQGAATSVIGRSANSTGNVADIAGTANQFLQVSNGNVLQFVTVSGDISFVSGVATIANSAVTLAKMANLAQDTIIGRATGAGTGVPQALMTLPTGVMPALTGDVTNSAGSLATTIAAGAVTFAKMASAAIGTAAEILSNTASKLVSVASLWSSVAPVALTVNATGAFTVTIASPAVVTFNSHGMVAGQEWVPTTTGALPTGMTAGTRYYVLATGLTTNTFQFAATRGGSAVNTSGTQSGTHTCTPWINIDFSLGVNFKATLNRNATMGSPQNAKDGQGGNVVINQDGTGSRTLAWATEWDWAGGSAPTLSTAASARDLLGYYVDDATHWPMASLAKAFA